ncbi:MAG: GGDEF domain-containing protein, partial [Gammaproteobacteria bacterium]|nr:GGDEF domain-containing protein [Gammaproteobacteria bacterium]
LPDGSSSWLSTRSYPIEDENGNVYRIAGLTVDITARKLLESETKMLARVVDQTADSVIIADKEGIIEYVNNAFENVSGYDRDEVVNQHTRILKSSMHDDDFYKKVSQTLQNGLPYKDLFINRRKDGELYYEEKTISPVRDEGYAITHYVSTGKDITQRLKMQQRMHNVIHYDAVTGLANNILLSDRLEQALLGARRKKLLVAIVKINIDVSELFGEGYAKELEEKFLIQVADRLKDSVRANDTVASVGPGDFVIVANEVINEEAIIMITNRMLSLLSSAMEMEGHTLFMRPNVGISVYPKDAKDKDELLAHADIAMQHAKQKKTSEPYRFFASNMIEKKDGVWLSS